MALTDDEIAVRYMTLMDLFPEDADKVEGVNKEKAAIIEKFQSSEHSGDCTKCPWTCMRCVVDEAFGMVPIMRKMFKIEIEIEIEKE